jgi:imidazole glycerol-phosphate synthase subunit HisH
MKVVIVDYGLGNLLSVHRALERCDVEAEATSLAEDIRSADAVILPGVGAFANGIAGLERLGLRQPLRDFAASGRPFLGICLGMQLMFEQSDEFGIHQGLGIMRGMVSSVPVFDESGKRRKIPHIGWSQLQKPAARSTWARTILESISMNDYAYFVHSYHAVPAAPEVVLAQCVHDGYEITAAVGEGNLWGCQFHPEKSGTVGLKILKSFLAMAQTRGTAMSIAKVRS